MSVFKLQVGSQFDISVETIQRGVTLPQYIQSKVDSREVRTYACLEMGILCQYLLQENYDFPIFLPLYTGC